MTSAERAKELMAQFYDELDWVSAKQADDMERRIASAITQAQNDKLEEAARCAQAIMAKADPGGCSWCAADEINTAILALKKD